MRPREVIALAIAPLASGMLQGSIMGNVGALYFGVVSAYVFAGLVGLPTLVALRRIGWKTLPKYVFAGSASGATSGLLLGVLWGNSNFNFGSVLGGLLLFSAHGFIVSLAYWLLAYSGSSTWPADQEKHV